MKPNDCLRLIPQNLRLILVILSLFAGVRTFAAPVPYAINVTDSPYHAVADGVTDATAAIQAAINAAGTSGNPLVVQIPYQGPNPPVPANQIGYRITSTLTIGSSNVVIDGGGATLYYEGTGPAIDAALLSNGHYPSGIKIINLNINLGPVGPQVPPHTMGSPGTAGAPIEGVRFRFSNSRMEGVNVATTNSYQNGFEFPGDGTKSSGPYYNVLDNLAVQGNAYQNQTTINCQNGIVFTPGGSAASNCANDNTFISGRTGEVDTGWLINGVGNTLFQPTAEGSVTAAFSFSKPAGSSSSICTSNSTYGGYVELGAAGAPAYSVGSTALNTYIAPGHITTISPFISDSGTNTQFIFAAGGGYQLGFNPTTPVGLGLYEPGNVQIYQYFGNPNGNVTAGVGSLCFNLSGGANTTLYVKESLTGNTGWVAK